MAQVEDMLPKMMRMSYGSYENVKEMRGDLGQKVDTHAVLIKHVVLHMAQMSTTLNPR